MKPIITSKLTLLIIALFTLYAQTLYAQKPTKNFLIEGNISGAADGILISLYDLDHQTILDSAYLHNGKFTFKGHVDLPATCWVQYQNKQLHEYAIIQVENVKMKFSSPLKNMQLNYTASGGREQSLQNKLDSLQRPYDRIFMSALDSLNNKLFANDGDKKRLIKIFNDGQNTSMKIYVDFGRQNINSYLGLGIIYRNRKTIPRDSMINLYNTIIEPYKSSPKGSALKMFLYEQLAEKGRPMIDFEAKTITGKPFKLSSLKGKYIYLAFGSAGCGPCRTESQEISKNYDHLSKLMEIVYFSLDKNRSYWQTVTKEDKITWTNISDMAGDYGKIKTIYGVQMMPTSFFIDKNGVIVKKIEGYYTETMTELEKLIKNSKD